MANANDPSTWPDLERVQSHEPPCGCKFLIAFKETRIRTDPEPTGVVEITENGPEPVIGRSKLHDVIEIHKSMVSLGLREDLPSELTFRVVTRIEAEEIVSAKRNHEWWKDHLKAEEQPYPRMCATHGKLPYNDETYAQVCVDNYVESEEV